MKPDARLRLHGACRLSDSELWTVVLSCEKAAEAVARYLPGLDDVAEPELTALEGVGRARASRVAAVVELGRRYACHLVEPGQQVTTANAVFEVVGPRLRMLKKERFLALALDSRNRVLRVFEIAEGHLGGVDVAPREVFRPLVRECAAATIIAHNHPSGDTTPSREDIALTRRLKEAGELMGVRVLDHVIVGNNSYTSLAEIGLV